MRYESSMVVNRPIDEVWGFLTDLSFNLPRTRTWILGFRWTSPGPPRLGSTFQQRVVILGVETLISGVVTEWDPPHTFTISMAGAGIRSGFIRGTLEAIADRTKAVGVMELEIRPAFKPLWWIAGPFLRRRWDASAPIFQRIIEAGRGERLGGSIDAPRK